MKAKVYPTSNIKKITLPPNQRLLNLEIICASLAKGNSIIKNVSFSDCTKQTIKWCENFGAIIKKNRQSLYIKGVNNKVILKTNIFDCESSFLTVHYLLPLLSLSNTNFVIKGKPEIIDSCDPFMYIFEKQNAFYKKEKNFIKIEQSLKPGFIYIDGENNNNLIVGLFIALPLLNLSSKLIIRAPIDAEKDLDNAIKILEKFGVVINKINKTTYEILPNQTYKGKKITTDFDYKFLTSLFIIGSLKGDIAVKGINKKSLQDDFRILDFLKKSGFSFNNGYIKHKPFYFNNINAEIYNNFIPLLIVLAIVNNQKTTITNLDLMNPTRANQVNVMLKNLKKLQIDYELNEDELTINPKIIEKKEQLESNFDPLVVMALTTLAIVSKTPLIIKDCQCINFEYADYFNILKQANVKIEFIHN